MTQPAARNHPIPAAWQAGGLAERANCREPGAFPAAPAAALLRSLPTRQAVTDDGPHPAVKLETITTRLEPCSSSLAVPSTCPRQESTTVANGQQRSLAEVPDLLRRRMVSSPTVLPKLAVFRPVRAGSVADG
jgi:hypothetical protein